MRITPGCVFCYAYTLAEDKRGTPAFPNGFDLTIRPHKLKEPFRLKSPTLIFVNSMSDLFWDQIPKSYAGVNYFLSSGVDYSRSPVADCSTVGPGTSSRDCLVRSRRSLTGIRALGPLKSDSSLNWGRFGRALDPFHTFSTAIRSRRTVRLCSGICRREATLPQPGRQYRALNDSMP
jgi:Protein of unknown function (DUF5131)